MGFTSRDGVVGEANKLLRAGLASQVWHVKPEALPAAWDPVTDPRINRILR